MKVNRGTSSTLANSGTRRCSHDTGVGRGLRRLGALRVGPLPPDLRRPRENRGGKGGKSSPCYLFYK